MPMADASSPAWVLCLDCGDWYCMVHHQHTGDCSCPPIEEWGDIDPYAPGSAFRAPNVTQHRLNGARR
jgi:hypothetical protein